MAVARKRNVMAAGKAKGIRKRTIQGTKAPATEATRTRPLLAEGSTMVRYSWRPRRVHRATSTAKRPGPAFRRNRTRRGRTTMAVTRRVMATSLSEKT
jgi:hypothetical protein